MTETINRRFVLAIVGSTLLAGNDEARLIIEAAIDRWNPTIIVSGGAVGIDRMAAAAGRRRGLFVDERLPVAHRWAGVGGFKQRNAEIADRCHALVRIISSKTKTYGSGWTRDRARDAGKPTEEFVVVQE